MTTNPQAEFTAELAERTVLVRWPDNERRGATPPADDWQDRAWSSQSTLHEIDEGIISGCSVLRWRDDPRPDAELLAVSLALVTGQAPAVAPVPPPADGAPSRSRVARLLDALTHSGPGYDVREPAVPPPADRATLYREAANSLAVLGPVNSLVSGVEAWDEAVTTLRRMADQVDADGSRLAAEQPTETPAPRRRLTPSEHSAAWHAIEGAAGEEGADPATVLHAVLDRLGIDTPAAVRPATT